MDIHIFTSYQFTKGLYIFWINYCAKLCTGRWQYGHLYINMAFKPCFYQTVKLITYLKDYQQTFEWTFWTTVTWEERGNAFWLLHVSYLNLGTIVIYFKLMWCLHNKLFEFKYSCDIVNLIHFQCNLKMIARFKVQRFVKVSGL